MGKGAVKSKGAKNQPKMNIEEKRDDSDSEEFRIEENGMMNELSKPSIKIEKKIFKKKLSEGAKKNKFLESVRDRVKTEQSKKLKEIKNRIKNKKEVKLDPSLLKNYNEKYETESQKLLNSQVYAAAKRKRLKKRTHYIKKQMFNSYIEKMQGNEVPQEPDFEMKDFSKELKFVEIDLEKEKQKFAQGKNHGISSTKTNTVGAREVGHVSKVLQHPRFKADPFGTITQHLNNSFAQKKK